MRRQWLAWVILLSFCVAPALAEEKAPQECPEMNTRLAELAAKNDEVEIVRLPVSGIHSLIVTVSPTGKWRLLIAEVSEFKLGSVRGMPVKIPTAYRLCDMWYGTGAKQGPEGQLN